MSDLEPAGTGTGGGPPHPFAEERRAAILRLLAERGRVRNTELAKLLRVTEPTIRKDVADLNDQRLLRRTHGGAVAVRPLYEPDLTARAGRHIEAKQAIARRCLDLIQDGDAVYLDSGTTVQYLADLLASEQQLAPTPVPRPRNVNVLTNSLPVAKSLAAHADSRHNVLGGTFRPTGGCFTGPLTISTLAAFTVNLAFIGVTGVTEAGFTAADLGEAAVKAAAIDRARRTIVVMDSSKVGASDFARVCGVEDADAVVTESASPYLRDLCSSRGVELIEAPLL